MADGEASLAEALAASLGAADGPAATEAAVASVLGLRPKHSLSDRALADVVVGCVAALRADAGSAAAQGAAAAVCVEAFRFALAGEGGWAGRDDTMALVREGLLEAAMPEGGGEAALTPEQAEAASRYLATTFFSQWELHTAVLRKGGGLPAREVLEVTRVVDHPRRPPPLAEASREGGPAAEEA